MGGACAEADDPREAQASREKPLSLLNAAPSTRQGLESALLTTEERTWYSGSIRRSAPMKPKTRSATRRPSRTAPSERALIVSNNMLIEYWPIDRPKDYPKNARKWSGQAIEKVAASIREYGWRQPVVVDVHDVVVIGHLRRAAGMYLGLTEVPVHVACDLTPAQIR